MADPQENKKYSKHIRNLLAIILAIMVLAILKISSEVSITLVLSLFLYLLFSPITTALDRSKVPNWLTTIIVVLLMVITLAVASWFVFFTVDALITRIPSYSGRLDEIDLFLASIIRRWVDLPEGFSLLTGFDIDWIGGVLMPALRSVSSSAIKILSNVGVTFLLVLFLILERSTIMPKVLFALDGRNDSKVVNIMERMNRQVSKYLSLKLFISVLTGIFFYLISKLAGLEFSFLWGVLAVVLNFIPTFGSIIITALTILMAILQFLPNWTPIIIVTVGTISTEMVLGNIIDPRLQGSQLNLSPFVILVALSIFGFIWGVVGMFLAVPLLSVIQIVFSNIDETRGFAIMLSSGKSYKKEMSKRNPRPRPTKAEDEFTFPDREQ